MQLLHCWAEVTVEAWNTDGLAASVSLLVQEEDVVKLCRTKFLDCLCEKEEEKKIKMVLGTC